MRTLGLESILAEKVLPIDGENGPWIVSMFEKIPLEYKLIVAGGILSYYLWWVYKHPRPRTTRRKKRIYIKHIY